MPKQDQLTLAEVKCEFGAVARAFENYIKRAANDDGLGKIFVALPESATKRT